MSADQYLIYISVRTPILKDLLPARKRLCLFPSQRSLSLFWLSLSPPSFSFREIPFCLFKLRGSSERAASLANIAVNDYILLSPL